MFRDYDYLFLFDVETTGLSKDVNEIIELGGILLKNNGEGKFESENEIDVFIQNDEPIPPFITDLTSITDDMCEDGLTKQEFFELLKPIFNDHSKTLIIAYNAPFDMGFIKSFMDKMSKGHIVTNDVLDLLEVAKNRTGLRKGNKLCDMLTRYNIVEFENSHRAIDDVKATLAVMRAMYKEKKDLEEYIKKGNWSN